MTEDTKSSAVPGVGSTDVLGAAHPLATERGLRTILGLLFFTGAMCPKCGYGTRVRNKRWSECKRCGERVERQSLPPNAAHEPPAANKHGDTDDEQR